jgi:hypothetical protein
VCPRGLAWRSITIVRVGLNEFAVSLAQKTGALRYDVDTVTDTLWMLAPDAYLRLVHDAGWPVERFQTWLADLLQRMFLGREPLE